MTLKHLRLGVNIDHVATLRNARGDVHPDPLRAAHMAKVAGADGITVHLREDRRHIRDADLRRIRQEVELPLNLEMAATDEMLQIALRTRPHACCIVPERREELTTEGGLDIAHARSTVQPIVKALHGVGIRVSLFIDAEEAQIRAASEVGADIVELHTGAYAHASGSSRHSIIEKLRSGAALATQLGVECHAGHGLTYDNVGDVAKIPEIVELNIGHFLMGEALFVGLEKAIRQMRERMDAARNVPRGDHAPSILS